MTRRTAPTAESLMVAAYSAGQSAKAIAAAAGVAKSTVQAVLARHGVSPRKPGRPGGPDRDAKLLAAWNLCGRAGRKMVAEDFGYASVESARVAIHLIRHGKRKAPPSASPPKPEGA